MQVSRIAALAALLQGAWAQAGPYAQCGGIGYSGSTVCAAGYTCTSQNPYYYQCVPATATTTTTTSSASASSTSSAPSTTCAGTFTPISAADFVANLNPGWNLGNTLDATPDEGSWNNPPVVSSTFDEVKAAGFKSVRLPVTYAYHFIGDSPDWTINATWLQRVSDVVDMITSRGLYTIVNAHHDSWIWADVTQPGANLTMIEEKFYRLWYQVGSKLACKSSLVAFEPINEPPCNDATDAAEINKLNTIFLKAINDAGGFNSQRVVTLVGGGEDSVKTSEWFVAPTGYSNPYAIQFHYYNPYDFIFSAWGKTIWGSDSDKSTLSTDLQLIRNNFTTVPLLIGEYDASPTNCETAARWKYFDYLIRTARALNISTIMWDNGQDHLDRTTGVWRDPSAIDIIMDATSGITNSLPDSTEDPSATTQWSSAYIFHKYGDPVSDQSLPFLFNGNSVSSISASDGTKLTPETDYVVAGSNITFKASFLSKYLSSTTAPGILANLTVSFSAGASEVIQLVQWKTPSLSSTSVAASAVNGSDLYIPITWGGIPKPAAVKAVEANGEYLVDSWTEYLPVIQQGRTTYSSQWNWDDSHIIITAATISTVLAAGQTTVFTFEFYPRDNGVVNAVNFTLTV